MGTALAVASIFILAGLVKGVVGLGLPTVVMGLLVLMMAPVEAAALLIIPSAVTNLWQLFAGPNVRTILSRLWPMMLVIFLATIAAAGLIATDDSRVASAALGAALLIYALLGLFQLKMNVRSSWERWLGPAVGAVTGVVTGATGVFTVPAVPYIAGLGLKRDELVQALGLSFTVSTFGLAAGLLLHGAFEAGAVLPSVGATVAALFGMAVGGRIRKTIRPDVFQRWFFIGLALLGLQILWQNLS